MKSCTLERNGSAYAKNRLRNAFRHAQAKRIEVALRYRPREFRLRVADNGKGIDYDSLGQVVKRARVTIVGGKNGGEAAGETKPFRLPFDDVPESWNQATPDLVIAAIEFA